MAPSRKNLPATLAQREIDDGGGLRPSGGTAVDDERNAVADLVADAGCVRALRGPLQIGRGRGDGQPEALHHRARNGGVGHAQGHVAGIRRGTQRQLAAGPHDDGQRAGPEALRQLVQQGVGVAGQLIGLGQRSNQQRQGLVLLAGLDLVNLLDRVEIDRVDGQAVEGVGRQGNDIAFAQTGDDIVDPVRLGFIGMDAQHLRGQEGLPQFPNCRRHKDGSYHSTSHGASCAIHAVIFAGIRNGIESAEKIRSISHRCLFALYRVSRIPA